MPDLTRTHSYTCDLAKDLTQIEGIKLLAGDDSNADAFTVSIKRNGTAVDATGAALKGYFTRADGTTAVIDGLVNGSSCSLTLAGGCYAVGGAFRLQLKLSMSGLKVTILDVRGSVSPAYARLVDVGAAYPDADELAALIDSKIDEPETEGLNGYVLTSDGEGGASWESASASTVAGTVQVDGTAYVLRTGTEGASGYLTFVLEAE